MRLSHSANGVSQVTSPLGGLVGGLVTPPDTDRRRTCQTILRRVVVSGPPRAFSRMSGSSRALTSRGHTSRKTTYVPSLRLSCSGPLGGLVGGLVRKLV